jgi:iron complex outermembrane receptor protein
MLVLPAAIAPARAEQGPDNTGIQEIVVTAQRAAQNVLEVPLSIQAITGEQLTREGLNDLTSLQFATPGLQPSDANGYTQIFIRGIGNNLFVGADPSVATFVDDVPRIWGSLQPDFINVARVEVLKGAQGGLYGRNATGGVVNIITRQPNTDKFEGNALVDYGERNSLRAAGYVNVPLNDKIAFDVAAERESHDPYVKNLATPNPLTAAMFPNGAFLTVPNGTPAIPVGGGINVYGYTPAQTAALFNSSVHPPSGVDNQDFWILDSKVLVKPSDIFKITFAFDYSEKNDSRGEGAFQATPAFAQASLTGLFNAFGIFPQFPPGFIQSSGKFTDYESFPINDHRIDGGGSATAVLSLPGVDVTSISAYRFQRSRDLTDESYLPVNSLQVVGLNDRRFFYQELRAVSSGTGPLQFLGGATFLYDDIYKQSTEINILPPVLDEPPALNANTIHNWSVYGQVGYDILPALNLTVSGRYVHEENNGDFEVVNEFTHFTEHKFLPSATLSYKLEDGGNVYARWARGFKAGGLNTTTLPSAFPTKLGSEFGPEIVDTFEAGYRASLLDHKVQFTADGFYNNYRGLQVDDNPLPQFPQILQAIVNAGSARTWGFEETLAWRVIQPLTLDVNAGYLNAKYTNFQVPPNGVLTPFNLSGTSMLFAPKLQLSLGADLDQPINDKYRLVGNVLVSHISTILFVQSGLPGILPPGEQSPYWLTNARIGVRTADDRYGIALYANNLFNKLYTTFAGSVSASGNVLYQGNPRVIGGEISAKF